MFPLTSTPPELQSCSGEMGVNYRVIFGLIFNFVT